MPKKLSYSSAYVLSVLGLCSIMPRIGYSQETEKKGFFLFELEEIKIVGSRNGRRGENESLAPVDVFQASSLYDGGTLSGELGQSLNSLVPSFNLPRQSNSDFADLVRPAQLRGLNPDQVLVLVNGKRRHTTASITSESKLGRGTSPVDLNSIPTSAIERIEILRDGAAAQYGSDAIAGVINVVLKDSAFGGSMTATYGQHSTEFDPTGERVNDGETVLMTSNTGLNLGDKGFLNLSLDYRNRESTNRAGLDEVLFEQQTPANLALQGQQNYRLGDGNMDDFNFAYNSGYRLREDMELYSFGTYSHRVGEGANFFRYPDGSQNVREIYDSGFVPITDATIDDYSLVFGTKGQTIDKLNWELSVAYGQNNFDWDITNSLNASLGVDSPTSFNVAEYQYSQWTLNADLSKNIDIGLREPVHFAFGGEYRDESFETTAGDRASYIAGSDTSKEIGVQGGPGLRPQDRVDQRRDAVSVYIDAETELSDKLSMGVAARYEEYSNFGDTYNGKLSARYQFTPALAWRATLSSGFRAPSLSQSFFRGAATSFDENGELEVVQNLPVNHPAALALGAVDLEPEESINYNMGLVGNFDSGFSFAVDFYYIEIEDRIALSENIGGDAVREYLTALGFPNIAAVRFFTNVADTQTEGVDVVTKYKTDFYNGQLMLSGAYNHSKTEIISLDVNPDILDNLGVGEVLIGVEEQNTLESAAPENKLILSSTWTNEDWTLMARASRFGSVKRVFSFDPDAQQRFGAEWIADLHVQYNLSEQLSFAVGGNNIFDNYPDESQPLLNLSGNLIYDVISPIGVNGAFYYSRVSYDF